MLESSKRARVVSIRITKDEWDAIQRLSEEMKTRGVSDVVRIAVSRFVESHRGKATFPPLNLAPVLVNEMSELAEKVDSLERQMLEFQAVLAKREIPVPDHHETERRSELDQLT